MAEAAGSATQTAEVAASARNVARVLVVEDNMIIAMDAEDHLQRSGVGEVVVVGSVEPALEEIAGDRFDLALLDYNLGEETSDPVAERLAELAIPFWFVTGYGDSIGRRIADLARGVVAKPFSAEILAGILEQFRSSAGATARS